MVTLKMRRLYGIRVDLADNQRKDAFRSWEVCRPRNILQLYYPHYQWGTEIFNHHQYVSPECPPVKSPYRDCSSIVCTTTFYIDDYWMASETKPHIKRGCHGNCIYTMHHSRQRIADGRHCWLQDATRGINDQDCPAIQYEERGGSSYCLMMFQGNLVENVTEKDTL